MTAKRVGVRVALAACAIALAAVAASCGGGGGGGPGSGGGEPLGGTIDARNAGVFATGAAAFYSSAGSLTDVDPNAYVPLGSCVPVAAATTATLVSMSVGTNVNLVSGSNVFPMPSGGGGAYGGFAGANRLPTGTTWDVVLTGDTATGVAAQTWSGALKVPSAPVVTAPAGFGGGPPMNVLHTTPLAFSWSSSGGATAVTITFTGGGAGTRTICRAKDTGTFTVGTATLANVPVNGSIVFAPYDFSLHVLNGRGVTITGESVTTKNYHLQ